MNDTDGTRQVGYHKESRGAMSLGELHVQTVLLPTPFDCTENDKLDCLSCTYIRIEKLTSLISLAGLAI